jgi:asparagine synthase (glutamine-hydrolysing)
MSAIAGVFTSDRATLAHGTLGSMFARMRQRATGAADVWRASGAALAVARHPWEMAGSLGPRGGLVRDGHVIVAADASLYYVGELRRRLERARVAPAGETPAHLIAAAYRAWGDRCAQRLEGDFAFVLWDTEARRVMGARDFYGTRPLHYAQVGGMLIVASTVGGVLAHPACPDDYDLRVLGETASGFFATDWATAYASVFAVPAGHDLVWQPPADVRLTRHWHPPAFEGGSPTPFDEAAEELRHLLTAAVGERLAHDAPTCVTLSGGWDSSAVFAVGKDLLRRRGAEHLLRPVSVSYPKGNPGREDELIEAIAEFWKSPVHWIASDTIGFFGDAWASATSRDEPFSHAFELWNRALAKGTRDVDARVMLDGSGGDQLFQVSLVYLADLLRRGRLLRLAREWRTTGMKGQGFRAFFRWAVQPNLPPAALRLAARVRGGRELFINLDRRPPQWIVPEFAERVALVERGRARALPELRHGSRASIEARWYLIHPLFAKVFALVSEMTLEEGVEARSPIMDQRVIALAATRPWEERYSGRETKRLLRTAMKGLLPDAVLAPRPYRTGSTGGIFDQGIRTDGPRLVAALFREPILSDLGIISREDFHRGWEQYLRTGDGNIGVQAYFTLQTELWLRAHSRGGSQPDAGVEERPMECASGAAGETSG